MYNQSGKPIVMCLGVFFVCISTHVDLVISPSHNTLTHTHTHTHTHTRTHTHMQLKETLDTVANLDEELREKVRHLSVDNTPPLPDTNPLVCNGYSVSNGPSNSKALSVPNGPSVSNCPPELNGPLDKPSSNVSINVTNPNDN